MLTDKQKLFIDLVNEYETLKERLKDSRSKLDALALEIGEGTYLQDPSSGVVLKICVPSGTFIEYKRIDYVRTRKAGEDRGSLSLKEAKAAGFEVKE